VLETTSLQHDTCDAFFRAFFHRDTEIYFKNPRVLWRHYIETDFGVSRRATILQFKK
jgi:hypothetical protein